MERKPFTKGFSLRFDEHIKLSAFLVSLAIILVMASLLLEVPTVHAQGQVPTIDTTVNTSIRTGFQQNNQTLQQINANTKLSAKSAVNNDNKEFFLDQIVWLLINTLIEKLANSITTWIQSGFQGGPAFLTDPAGAILDLADETMSRYLASSKYRNLFNTLCSPYKGLIDLNLNFGLRGDAYARRYSQCNLRQIVANIKGGYTDTSRNGWDGWISLTTQPENNVFGLKIIAEESVLGEVGKAVGIKSEQLNWSGGFLSQEKCTDAQGAPTNDKKNAYACETVTPGSVVESQINDSLSSGKHRIEAADEINEVIGALVGQLTKLGTEGLVKLTSRGGGTPPPPTGSRPPLVNPLQPDPVIPWEFPPDTTPPPAPPGTPPGTPPGGPGPAPTNTVIGAHMVNAEVQGSTSNGNVYNMRFTPSGNGLKISATTARPVTTVGQIKALAGSVYLCPPGGCLANVRPAIHITNIATQTGGSGIDFTLGTARPLKSTTGFITADQITGVSTGVWADTVDTQGKFFLSAIPTITHAEIIDAQVVGNITDTNLVGGRIVSGTLTVAGSPRYEAHLAADTTYTNHGSTAPVAFNVTTTSNVSRIDSGFISQGTVTRGQLTNGMSLVGYTVAYNFVPCVGIGCVAVTGGTLTNIQGLSAVTSSGGIIASGKTTGEADLRSSAGITGTITNQGTLVK